MSKQLNNSYRKSVTLPIHNFLQKCYTNKDKQNYKETTHVSLNPQFQGSFVIAAHHNEFDKLYLSTLEQQIKKKTPLLYLAQKRHDTSQILIDLDFQKNINQNQENEFYDTDSESDIDLNQRLYSNLFIKVFINQYMKHLQTYIEVKQQIKIYVLEKTKTYTNNGYVKDGIHIQIPQIIIPLQDQSFIRKKILNDSIVLQQYNNLNLSQPFCKCFDNSATKNVNWLLYGSQKPNNEPYYCKQIYSYNPQTDFKLKNDLSEPPLEQELEEEDSFTSDSEDQLEQDNSDPHLLQKQVQDTDLQIIQGQPTFKELSNTTPSEERRTPPTKLRRTLELTDDEFSDSDDEIDEQQYKLDNITLDIDGFQQIMNNYPLQHLYIELSIQQQSQNVEYTQLYKDELQIIQQRELSKQLAQQKINKIFDQSQEENVLIAKQLIELLSNERADNYDDWMHIGWCCKNISDHLYESWIEFSSKSHKFNADECYRRWQDFEKRDMTIASLKYWAKQDNPSQYQNIINNSVNKYIYQAQGQFNHFNVALLIYHMYKGQFICSNASRKQWWHFQDHRWKSCDNAYLLHNYISTEVKEVFILKQKSLTTQQTRSEINLLDIEHKEKQQKVLNKQQESETKYDTQQRAPASNSLLIDDQLKQQKDQCENQIKKLDKEKKKLDQYIMKLGENSFKNGVVKELAHIFLQDDPYFLDKLDNNPNILCFNNGVYDLERNTFRNGVPTDYVTLSTGYDFLTNIDKQDPTLKEIKKYMKQVFVNDDTRTYIWNLFASFLSGTKLDEKFYFMNGCGSNSKSVLLKLLSQSLGDYSTNISVTAVTGKRTQSAQANPEIAASKTARLVIMQEPGNHDQLNIGVVKEFSGNDRIRARMLYDNGTQFTPKFRMVLVCNHLPEVSSQDDGTWRRIQVITFKSKFCANPDKSKNEFKIKSSANIDQKIQKWIPYFMFLLIQRFKTLPKNRPVQESSDVKKDTSEYKRSNNIILCFFQDRYIILDQKRSSPLIMNDIYQEYSLYCREYNYTKQKTNEVRTFINRHLQIQDLKNDEFYYIDSK